MLELAIFVLAIYGLANGATVLKAKAVTRFALGWIPVMGGVARCPACFAFWAALAASVFVLSPSAKVVESVRWAPLIDALLGSGSTWLLHAAQERLLHGIPESDK
jgi:Na+/phosphate symporter